ncbi:MAG: fibrobacter succinogenes major paralogous domain-containing protein [Fibrobacter sp.]|nr:fibrobacter succinogenes major paralogous domain-containing protein [Fibrobacter sp.]
MKNVVLDEARLFGTSKLSPWGVVALIATMAILLFALAACGGAGEPTDVTETDFVADSSEDSSHDGNAGENRSSAPSSATSESSSSLSLSSSLSVESSSSFPPGFVDPSTVVMGEMTDSRDGQTYKTVTIGDQVWMAENLNYAYTGVSYKGKYGSASDSTSWCYNDESDFCLNEYGRLYTWATAMDSVGTWNTNGKGCGSEVTCSPTYPVQGICPSGWHLPDTTEWETLFTAVGGPSIAGMTLKSDGGWTYKNDYSGWIYRLGGGGYSFGARPAGQCSWNFFSDWGNEAYFWSSTEVDSDMAGFVNLSGLYNHALMSVLYKGLGFSVRCLKD